MVLERSMHDTALTWYEQEKQSYKLNYFFFRVFSQSTQLPRLVSSKDDQKDRARRYYGRYTLSAEVLAQRF
jgi:hypothetical protein